MELLEYQAKTLFKQVGIPTLPSQTIHHPGDLKKLTIPYPIVLKSQVHAGGRGKAGGVRFVENTIDAIAATRAIFNLSILGEYPNAILAEARFDIEKEIFLAIVLDYQLQYPVLLGSYQGGIDIDLLIKHMQKVVVTDKFSPYYARRLAIAMGLRGEQIEAVSLIVQKMYQLFCDRDLEFIEINPLAINHQGKVMALDGKIATNDDALGRHGDLEAMLQPSLAEPEAKEGLASIQWLSPIDNKGKVSIISNSRGLALTYWDLFTKARRKVATAMILDTPYSAANFIDQIKQAIAQAEKLSSLKVLLIDIFGNQEIANTVAEAIADWVEPDSITKVQSISEDRSTRATGISNTARPKQSSTAIGSSRKRASLPIVLRLAGGLEASLMERLSALSIFYSNDLTTAIKKATALSRSRVTSPRG